MRLLLLSRIGEIPDQAIRKGNVSGTAVGDDVSKAKGAGGLTTENQRSETTCNDWFWERFQIFELSNDEATQPNEHAITMITTAITTTATSTTTQQQIIIASPSLAGQYL